MSTNQCHLTLEVALSWARSGNESDKVYRFLFLHPDDFFTIPNGRKWSIAHQVVFNGNLDLFKRILALFSDDQINIRTLSKDRKSLLDVAEEQQSTYQPMYAFVKHLFLQDDLIQAAKESDWRSVRKILKDNPELINEKPPYSTYFLLHYLVQNGEKVLLEELFGLYPFQTNVLSADNETPLEMAQRLQKHSIYAILEPTTRARVVTSRLRRQPSCTLPCIIDTPSETQPSSVPLVRSAKTTSPFFSLPYSPEDTTPYIGFSKLLLEITDGGQFTYPDENPYQIVLPPTSEHVTASKKESNPDVETQSSTAPTTPSSNEQLMKNITCPLTQKVFDDPVIANDGQTYERGAITEWVNSYHCSPITGTSMTATCKDDTEIKEVIQNMRRKSLREI